MAKEGSQKPVAVGVQIAVTPPVGPYADRCAFIQREKGVYEIAFLDTAAGRAVVRIVVAEGPLVEHFWGTSTEFYQTTREWTQKLGIDLVAPLDSLGQTSELPDAQAANVFRFFRIGLEAAIEAYYIPPGVIHELREKAQHGDRPKSVKPMPVCYVPLSLPVLMGLLERVERLVTEVQRKAQ